MIQRELTDRLIADWGFERRDTKEGERLTRGRCPACGEREAFTPPGKPFVIMCPRANKCGTRTYAKALYPELFEQFAKHNPTTRDDPHATARAYLRSRGIDPEPIADWWRQGAEFDPAEVKVRKARPTLPPARKYPTVQFTLANGVAYHRLIDYAGKNKNKIVAAFRGSYWAPPDFDPAGFDGELWMAEGVLNAVSLCAAGKKAVANLSSKHVPSDLLAALRPRTEIVIAQDHDKAGRDSARVLAAACKERGLAFRYAFPPAGADWNDLLLRGDFAPKRHTETFNDAQWLGDLFGAETAVECFEIWTQHERSGLFEFKGAYWMGKAGAGGSEVRRLSYFLLEPQVVIAKRQGGGRVEHELVATLLNNHRPTTLRLTGKELSSHKDFKAAVRTRAWGNWLGGQSDLDALTERIDTMRPPIVHEIQIVGWDEESDCYFFPDVAYDPAGRPITPDAYGRFAINGRIYSLGLPENEKPIRREGPEQLPEALRALHQAFGSRALAVLGFCAASLFANQFSSRPSTRFFPFLSLFGKAGTGKTSILYLMNRFLGRDVGEGLSLSAVDTAKGSTRQIAAVSNLPVALLEMDHAKAQRFDLNRLLPLFNRGALQVRAQKSHDLGTSEVRFLGTLLFAQNEEQFQGEPQKSRVVSIGFFDPLDGARLAANKALLGMPYGALAAFRHALLSVRNEAQEQLFSLYDDCEAMFGRSGVGNARVAQTHAVVLAGTHLALLSILPANEANEIAAEVFAYLLDIAKRKLDSLFTGTEYVALFADTVASMLGSGKIADHSEDSEEVWLHMADVKTAMEDKHAQFDFRRIYEELETTGKVLFRGESKYSKRIARSLRLHGFHRTLFYP